MNRRCRQGDCYVHEGQSCALGYLDIAECPSWTTEDKSPEPSVLPTAHNTSGVPWSSSALGVSDLLALTARGRSILIGVLGAHDAGKTTLLTANYLHLLHGRTLAGSRFAGSRTLGAWEALAAWTRFDDAARAPSFPPHTPRGTARVPGLLHLALRGTDDEHRDVLLTDAPGEWFARWSFREDAAEAEGARWVERHADAFLLFADCARLSGPERGKARNDTQQLIERLGNTVGARPTMLVWAKHDTPPPGGIQRTIRESLKARIPHATEVETTIREPETLALALEQPLRRAWTPPLARPLVAAVEEHRPFAAFRGHRANP